MKHWDVIEDLIQPGTEALSMATRTVNIFSDCLSALDAI
jgi:hypothetical protein